MKRQVSFEDTQDSYRFVLVGDGETAFEIGKGTLTFSTNDFYKLFFMGLKEKPEYELVQPADSLQGQAKHVFDTVKAIFKKACDSIDASWFVEDEEQAAESVDAPSEESF